MSSKESRRFASCGDFVYIRNKFAEVSEPEIHGLTTGDCVVLPAIIKLFGKAHGPKCWHLVGKCGQRQLSYTKMTPKFVLIQ